MSSEAAVWAGVDWVGVRLKERLSQGDPKRSLLLVKAKVVLGMVAPLMGVVTCFLITRERTLAKVA